jgi:hypothetical protein
LTTGRFPFPGNNPATVLRSIIDEEPDPPYKINPRVDQELSSLIMQLISKGYDRRPTAKKIKNMLHEYLDYLSISDASQELKDFYLNPSEYQKRRNDSFIQSLTKHAKRFIQDRKYSKAIMLLNRAICSGADNKEVIHLLNSARFIRRAWVYPVVLVFLIIVLLGGFKILEKVEFHQVPSPPGSVNVSPVFSHKPVTLEGTVKERDKSTTRTKKIQRQKETKSAISSSQEESASTVVETKTGKVTIRTTPWADVFIDHRFYGRTPFIDTVELSEGRHTIEVRNPYAESVRKDIIVEGNKSIIEHITLPLLPGKIDITLNIDGKLYIDGKFMGTGRVFESIVLSQGRHTLRIEKEGYRPVEKSIDMEAGGTMSLNLELVKEPLIWKD